MCLPMDCRWTRCTGYIEKNGFDETNTTSYKPVRFLLIEHTAYYKGERFKIILLLLHRSHPDKHITPKKILRKYSHMLCPCSHIKFILEFFLSIDFSLAINEVRMMFFNGRYLQILLKVLCHIVLLSNHRWKDIVLFML